MCFYLKNYKNWPKETRVDCCLKANPVEEKTKPRLWVIETPLIMKTS